MELHLEAGLGKGEAMGAGASVNLSRSNKSKGSYGIDYPTWANFQNSIKTF